MPLAKCLMHIFCPPMARSWNSLFWLLHLGLLGGILLGLTHLSHVWDLERALSAPWPKVTRYWLPAVFYLCYLLFCLSFWLLRLLRAAPEATDFADIDQAWQEATQALHQAGIDLTAAPVFVVLGRPAGGEEALFHASRLPLLVKHEPQRASAPLHVFANPEAIFVTCAGASLLGRHSAVLAEESVTSTATSSAVNRFQEMQDILARARQEGRGPDQLTPMEKQRIGALVAWEQTEVPAPHASLAPEKRGKGEVVPKVNAADVGQTRARFRHLCRLIARDRHPYCPINGLVMLVPLAASNSEGQALQTAALMQLDLQTARDVCRVDCPLFVLVCDLEKVPGLDDLLRPLPEASRLAMLGRRFALVPDLEPAEIPAMIDSGLSWLCETLLPWYVYHLMRLEGAGHEADFLERNIRLYQLLDLVRSRRGRLSQIVRRGLPLPSPPMLAGCFLTATGADAARAQAFVAEVFQDVVSSQNYVAWTDRALAEESLFGRLTRLGYAAAGLLLSGLMGLGFYFWQKG